MAARGPLAGLPLLLLALHGVAAAAAGAPAAQQAGMEPLRHFLERVQSMRADFRQETLDDKQEVTEEARGHVALKRPGRFRWDYEEPYQRVVVADGKRLWLYEADLQQVTVRPLAAGLGETPAALLTGERDILDRFEYVASWSGEGITWVRLKPRSTDSDFESVAIGFTGDKPVQLDLDNRLGQQTRLYLTRIEMGPAISDETFQLKIPDGVDVIREGEL